MRLHLLIQVLSRESSAVAYCSALFSTSPCCHGVQAELEAMLSTNAALLDGGAMLQRCSAGVGHLLSRPQLMRSLAQDPAFLYQVRG